MKKTLMIIDNELEKLALSKLPPHISVKGGTSAEEGENIIKTKTCLITRGKGEKL